MFYSLMNNWTRNFAYNFGNTLFKEIIIRQYNLISKSKTDFQHFHILKQFEIVDKIDKSYFEARLYWHNKGCSE